MLAKTPREATGISDITGGLPRVTEIFEARKPKDPAVIAEIDGVVEISGRRNARQAHDHGPQRDGDRTRTPGARTANGSWCIRATIVKAGQALVEGPLVPHDILRVSGEEAVQQYLVQEIQRSIAASGWKSTTSTSRSSSPACSARSAWRIPGIPTCFLAW